MTQAASAVLRVQAATPSQFVVVATVLVLGARVLSAVSAVIIVSRARKVTPGLVAAAVPKVHSPTATKFMVVAVVAAQTT